MDFAQRMQQGLSGRLLDKGQVPDVAADAWRACKLRCDGTKFIQATMVQDGREWKFDAQAPIVKDWGPSYNQP